MAFISEQIPVVHIRPSRGMRGLGAQELWRYRDLFYFMVWKEIKVRYAQSVLGVAWAVIQPAAFMVVFTVVFGGLVNMSSDGVPYAIFSYTALVPWTFFSTSLPASAGSLVQNRVMLTRIYFPRLIMPTSVVTAKLLDFTIAFTILFALMAWFRITPTIWALLVPWFIVLMVMAASGLGMWLSTMSVQYRDIQYSMNLVVQLLMYAAPVVYPISLIPDRYRLLYGLNPMVGVIEGFRSALLGTNPMPWDLLAMASVTTTTIAVSGVLYFRRMERVFADVV